MPSLNQLRQSAAEVLAWAMCELFPGVQLVDSGVTEFGFFYDFIAEQPIDQQALAWLEQKMLTLMKQESEVRMLSMMRQNASQFFTHHGQTLLAERMETVSENIVSILQMGKSFYDYASFSNVTDLKALVIFKLLNVEQITHYFPLVGALSVTRIHGTVFHDKASLKKYLKTIEPGKKRDHRVLGKELDLYELHDEASHHSCFWHPRGAVIKELLTEFWRHECRLLGYQIVSTPPLIKEEWLKQSGFFENIPPPNPFSFDIEEVPYLIPPTFSPAHAALFQAKLHSYRELPIRYAECASMAKIDKSQRLWGLLHMRLVCGDEAHIFCTPGQLKEELISYLQFIDKITKIFSFEYHWYLWGPSQKFAGTPDSWKKCLADFEAAFRESGTSFVYNEHEGQFAGPLAEAYLIDALGREWRGPQIGINFNYPEHFGLRYQGPDDEMHLPLMVVQSLFGSLERFVAILVEHYAGQFPVWLAPEQVRVIPVAEVNNAYANEITKALKASGYRVSADMRLTQLGSKVHEAKRYKIPYLVILGDREEKQHLITVRSGIREVIQNGMTLEDFLKQLKEEISSKIPPEIYSNAH